MLSVVVANGNASSAGGTTVYLEVDNPLPSVQQLAPAGLVAGSAAATTGVTGSGFSSVTVFQVNGSARTAVVVSPTQATLQLTAADLAVAGSLSVTAINPAPGGGTSAAASFAVNNPVPAILSISPASVYQGAITPATVTIQGSNFLPGTTVMVGTAKVGTSLVGTSLRPVAIASSSQLSFTLTVADQANAATLNIIITTPAPGGGSAQTTFAVLLSVVPVLESVSPVAAPIQADVQITLSGSNFSSSSIVSYNGQSLPTTYQGPSGLSATLPAALIQQPGNGSLTVVNSGPGGGTSSPLSFTAYIALANNSVIFNPVTGLLYASVPTSAGPPYADSVLTIDPATGLPGTPIPVGSNPNLLALSSDGRFLWVGLDGSGGVRKVDLTTGTAGLQFTLPGSGGSARATAIALAALPGSTDSVVVSSTSGTDRLDIFDNGTGRAVFVAPDHPIQQLIVDALKRQVYAGDFTETSVYGYDAAGLTLKPGTPAAPLPAPDAGDLQIAGDSFYNGSGHVYDVQTGAPLGTFTGTAGSGTSSTGDGYADLPTGKEFVLDPQTISDYFPAVIQAFHLSDFSAAGQVAVGVRVDGNSNAATALHLGRWGADGLFFRDSEAIYAIHSPQVKNLTGPPVDLQITISASGTAVGGNTTYTATITNAGPAPATNVTVAGFPPSTGALVAITPSVGTCQAAQGLTCSLGSLPSGGMATVTCTIQQNALGTAVMTVQVNGSENDAMPANNQAASTLTIVP